MVEHFKIDIIRSTDGGYYHDLQRAVLVGAGPSPGLLWMARLTLRQVRLMATGSIWPDTNGMTPMPQVAQTCVPPDPFPAPSGQVVNQPALASAPPRQGVGSYPDGSVKQGVEHAFQFGPFSSRQAGWSPCRPRVSDPCCSIAAAASGSASSAARSVSDNGIQIKSHHRHVIR